MKALVKRFQLIPFKGTISVYFKNYSFQHYHSMKGKSMGIKLESLRFYSQDSHLVEVGKPYLHIYM
jgi:hypothetical protein